MEKDCLNCDQLKKLVELADALEKRGNEVMWGYELADDDEDSQEMFSQKVENLRWALEAYKALRGKDANG